MAVIEYIKGSTDWAGEAVNVETMEDIVFDSSSGIFRFTGFVGVLCDQNRDSDVRFTLQIAAVVSQPRTLTFRGRITVGHGTARMTSRISISENVFALCCGLHASKFGHLLDPQIGRVEILHGAPNSFVPTNL